MYTLDDYITGHEQVFLNGDIDLQDYLAEAVRYQKQWDQLAMERPWYMPLLYWRFFHVKKLGFFPPILVQSRDPLMILKQRYSNPDRVWGCCDTSPWFGSHGIMRRKDGVYFLTRFLYRY